MVPRVPTPPPSPRPVPHSHRSFAGPPDGVAIRVSVLESMLPSAQTRMPGAPCLTSPRLASPGAVPCYAPCYVPCAHCRVAHLAASCVTSGAAVAALRAGEQPASRARGGTRVARASRTAGQWAACIGEREHPTRELLDRTVGSVACSIHASFRAPPRAF